MDKNAIKKFAVWARRELIERVSQKALQYGITADETVDAGADSINGHVLSDNEKQQRQALILEIENKGYEEVMEEVAYTWFNRFSALRFMEVNEFLPSHVRVFTDEENNFKPQIIDEAIHMELDGLDMEKVFAYKEANQTEELYKYLLITQCNALNKILPGMFQKISDYTELLLPDNLLREGSVIQQMIALIPEEDWRDAVQIIGWLYQYYNAEKKDDVFAALKKNVKITKENIPAATQLFTPDWIVRYMVENSLGRLWVEGHPNDDLKAGWKYYLEEAQQEPEVEAQLAEIRKGYAAMEPKDIKVIDPCCGSGHILAYLFDVLMQIYESYGYVASDAVASILQNNLYGLDIDDRAAQLAYFAVMMKARRYDRRFFSHTQQPHVYAIRESNHLDSNAVDYFCNGDDMLTKAIATIRQELFDAKEYGSILTVTQQDWSAIYNRFDQIFDDISMFRNTALSELLPLVRVAEALAQKYDTVVTNPPYMGSGGMEEKLLSFVKSKYPDEKLDLSTVMMTRCEKMVKVTGFVAMINIPVWMFISSYSELRTKIINNDTIVNMLHLGRGVFGSDFGTTAFVIQKSDLPYYRAVYRKLHTQIGNVDTNEQKERWLFEGFGFYTEKKISYNKIPTMPIAYWLGENAVQIFVDKPSLREVADPRQGLATGNDERYLRSWNEVDWCGVGIDFTTAEEFWNSEMQYAPFNKGGAFRKWYGNNNLVIRFSHSCYNELLCSGNHLPSRQMYFRQGITWSALTAGNFSGRYCRKGFVFAGKGPMCFPYDDENTIYLLGFLNSKLTNFYMEIFSSTTDFNQGPMRDLPLIMDCGEARQKIEASVTENIQMSKSDWDSFETSWDFKRHPLV